MSNVKIRPRHKPPVTNPPSQTDPVTNLKPTGGRGAMGMH